MHKFSLRSVHAATRLGPWLLFSLAVSFALFALAAEAADATPVAPATAATPVASDDDARISARKIALARAAGAVVGIRATAVEDASSTATLGRKRTGSGIVIGADGLVLTIGYLILEADRVDVLFGDGHVVPARIVGYDLATGFGLLQALAPLPMEPAPLGNSGSVASDEPLLIASGGDDAALSLARMVSRRAYSGYWEYHIDGALFTAPARPDHSGAALINADGELLGIGSLIVSDALGSAATPLRGNMFVPVDLLKPILAEMRERGASSGSSRAWLGVNCVEYEGQVRVLRLGKASPAEESGLLPGDRIVAVDGVAVDSLEAFYKALWRDPPERDVRLDIRRGAAMQTLNVHSLDRMKTLRRPRGI